MLINREANRYDLPVNESASILAQRIIHGDVILVGEPEWDWMAIFPSIPSTLSPSLPVRHRHYSFEEQPGLVQDDC